MPGLFGRPAARGDEARGNGRAGQLGEVGTEREAERQTEAAWLTRTEEVGLDGGKWRRTAGGSTRSRGGGREAGWRMEP
jgi:hypothetical protein